MPTFDILAPGAGGPSGLLIGLDPAYQAKQIANDQARLQLRQAQLFQDGFPTDKDGNPDWVSASLKSAQAGDYASAEKFQTIGQQQSALSIAQRNAGGVGQYGGAAPASGGGAGAPGAGGGSLVSALAGAQPAAGGGMIAPSAGGDDYGRAPGGGYGGTGQVGAGSVSAPAPVGQRPASPAGGQGAASTGGLDPLDVYAHSIGSLESSNRYDALGQKQANGSQAIGRYQVMSSNVGPWTKEVLGTAMSPEEFRASPEAQDAVFRAKFGQSLQQYGNPFDAASVWFSGRPLNRAGNASDSLGTTVPAYIQRFAAGLGPASQALRGGQGQAGGAQAPTAGGQAQAAGGAAPQGEPAGPISFNSPGLSPPDVGGTSGGPVGDSEVMAARKLVAQSQDADPRTMTLDQQRAVSAATDTMARYQDQQAQPAGASAGTVNGAPVSSDAKPPSGQHPFAPGSNAVTGIRAPLMAPAGVQDMPRGGAEVSAGAGGCAEAVGGPPRGEENPAARTGAEPAIGAAGLGASSTGAGAWRPPWIVRGRAPPSSAGPEWEVAVDGRLGPGIVHPLARRMACLEPGGRDLPRERRIDEGRRRRGWARGDGRGTPCQSGRGRRSHTTWRGNIGLHGGGGTTHCTVHTLLGAAQVRAPGRPIRRGALATLQAGQGGRDLGRHGAERDRTTGLRGLATGSHGGLRRGGDGTTGSRGATAEADGLEPTTTLGTAGLRADRNGLR